MGNKYAVAWDEAGKKVYETGVDRAVLYPMKDGSYGDGEAWNGFSKLTESPSGAEATKFYANNGIYIVGRSAEEYEATLEAYTYPDGFKACNGESQVAAGVTIGQQERESFGLTYRSFKGNDTKNTKYGYIIHLLYGGTVSPSEKEHNTINDSFEANTMSWPITTTPVTVDDDHKPTATLEIDSTKVDAAKLAVFEKILYGTAAEGDSAAVPARLPLPAEVISLFGATA